MCLLPLIDLNVKKWKLGQVNDPDPAQLVKKSGADLKSK